MSPSTTAVRVVVTTFAVLLATGCSAVEDKVRDSVDRVSNDAAAQAIERAVADQLARSGVALDGEPDCSPDLSVQGVGLAGVVDCTARTEDGKQATARFDGTIGTSGCDGSLVVEVAGRKVVDLADVPGCSVSTG